jgi:hypothetical protein
MFRVRTVVVKQARTRVEEVLTKKSVRDEVCVSVENASKSCSMNYNQIFFFKFRFIGS